MKIRNIKQNLFAYEQILLIAYLLKWSFFALLVGVLSGSASALFLNTLQWATNWRNAHEWIIAFLPIGGFVIGALYYYYGQSVVKGNNQLLDEFQDPKRIIPFRMAPLVFFGTIATHFFGGSAGREGTGVQIGGAIADQLTRVFKLNIHDRRILIVCGISGGFASVFGTPLAGAIFALEVLVVGRMRYEAIVASFLTALIANISCNWWGVDHTHYEIPFVPSLTLEFVGWSILAGIAFGLTAMLFSKMSHQIGKLSVATIKYPPLRPVIGGALLAFVVYLIGTTKYIGLGVPTIVDSFSIPQPEYAFMAKLLFTTFTLGMGFKGGEVTPLFFIGATLGNTLSFIIPLPMALLAGMGFVAVFAGAANTPIACLVMGIELFGIECGIYLAIACVVAYLFSGHSGIYTSQLIGSAKYVTPKHYEGKRLGDVK